VQWGADAHGPDLDAPAAAVTSGETAADASSQASPAAPARQATGEGSAPADLATARQTVFAAAKIDTAAYVTIRDMAER
ncbi:hypothetical protein, partial [Xanthomonas translucens]